MSETGCKPRRVEPPVDDTQPRGRSGRRGRKRYTVECNWGDNETEALYSLVGGRGWHVWGRYTTAADRDRAIEQLNRSHSNIKWQFRAAPTDPDQSP